MVYRLAEEFLSKLSRNDVDFEVNGAVLRCTPPLRVSQGRLLLSDSNFVNRMLYTDIY